MTQHTYKLITDIDPSIFRAYDIRGIVGESLCENAVYSIGRAIGHQLLSENGHNINVARDGRLSSPTLITALTHGLQDSGIDVIDIGIVPTPLLYYATHTLQSSSGIMLTGSHNPKEYNGLKIVLNQCVLAQDDIQSLHASIPLLPDTHKRRGTYQQIDIQSAYIDAVCQKNPLQRPLKIVVDCGNGVAGIIAPQLYRKLGCEVIELYCEVDGTFPNHHPNPGEEETLNELIAAVKKHQADIGLAFDGDGDRLGIVDQQGTIIRPDRQMMLFAKDLLSRQPGKTVIFDVKCSQYLESVIRQHHGIPLMWKTGHALIRRKMQAEQAPLAGEMSGHIFFAENWYGFDDALFTGAVQLKLLSEQPHPVSTLYEAFSQSISTPEILITTGDQRKFDIMQQLCNKLKKSDIQHITIDGLRLLFDHGWALIRASNTTPCLTLRFEADKQDQLIAIQAKTKALLCEVDTNLALPF